MPTRLPRVARLTDMRSRPVTPDLIAPSVDPPWFLPPVPCHHCGNRVTPTRMAGTAVYYTHCVICGRDRHAGWVPWTPTTR